MSNVKQVLVLSLLAVGLAGCGLKLGTARNVERCMLEKKTDSNARLNSSGCP